MAYRSNRRDSLVVKVGRGGIIAFLSPRAISSCLNMVKDLLPPVALPLLLSPVS